MTGEKLAQLVDETVALGASLSVFRRQLASMDDLAAKAELHAQDLQQSARSIADTYDRAAAQIFDQVAAAKTGLLKLSHDLEALLPDAGQTVVYPSSGLPRNEKAVLTPGLMMAQAIIVDAVERAGMASTILSHLLVDLQVRGLLHEQAQQPGRRAKKGLPATPPPSSSPRGKATMTAAGSTPEKSFRIPAKPLRLSRPPVPALAMGATREPDPAPLRSSDKTPSTSSPLPASPANRARREPGQASAMPGLKAPAQQISSAPSRRNSAQEKLLADFDISIRDLLEFNLDSQADTDACPAGTGGPTGLITEADFSAAEPRSVSPLSAALPDATSSTSGNLELPMTAQAKAQAQPMQGPPAATQNDE